MVLVVSLPFAYAEPEEELTTEEGYTDLIINVKNYEPTVIVSSLIEEQNIPIYAFLSAIPTEGLSVPRIQSIGVSIVGGNKSLVAGGVQYHKPHMYSWDDLGYLSLKLKSIEKEKDVPDEINLELKAKIRYEADVTSGIVEGREERILYERPVVDITDILIGKEYNFFGGKGKIQVERISGSSVTFALYSSEGERISRFSVGLGKESSGVSLVKGSNIPEDFVRVRVNEIVDDTQDSAVISIDGLNHTANIGKEILGWKITKINKEDDSIELIKGRERTFIHVGNKDDQFLGSPDEIVKAQFGGKTFEKESLKLLINGFKELRSTWGDFDVKEVREGEKPEAIFNIGAVKEGFPIDSSKKKTDLNYCEVTNIKSDRVSIQTSKGLYTLRLVTEEEREKYEERSTQIVDELGAEYCGRPLLLENINTKKSVKVSLLSGEKRGYTESVFWLHLPIEKRPFDLSPRALDKRINQTKKQLEQLNKNIDRFEDIVKNWRKVCLATAASILILNFFSGFGGVGENTEKGCEDTLKKKIVGKAAKEIVAEQSALFIKGECKSPPFYKVKDYADANGKDLYIRNDVLNQYYIFDKTSGNCVPVGDKVVYKKGKEVGSENEEVWDWEKNKFVPYKGVKDIDTIMPSIVGGENAVIVPIWNPDEIPIVKNQYINKWRLTQGVARKGLYAVVYKDRVDFWQGRGDVIDIGDSTMDRETDDPLKTFYKNDVQEGKKVYQFIESRYMNKISKAQSAGSPTVNVAGKEYKLKKKEFNAPGIKCECIMAEWKCRLLYNACDPVICPPSRCDFGGDYKVDSVIKSGIVGSLTLCLKNFGPWREGGVLVPFCLSGLLASMKNIRSFLQGYESCLIDAKVNGKSTGICDKIRSIFICEIIWEETLSLFKLKGGILGMITRPLFSKLFSGGKGGEVTGFAGAVEDSKSTVNYFVNTYAKEISLAYTGRSTDQIKKEVCKSAIAGKFPDFGKFVEEFATPEDPVQFTAYFEEHPYSPTRGESRYQVYYHIYAGNPRNRETINYKVYFKPTKLIASGSLKPGEFADESVDIIAKTGFQEICVNINGVETCNFGKVVSTSFGLTKANEWWMVKYGGLAPDIQYASQCVSEIEGGESYVPRVAVRRKCSVDNPNAGLGSVKENEWYPVGRCDVEGGKSQGVCWAQADLRSYPGLKSDAYSDLCEQQGGVWCVNMTCPVGAGSYLNLQGKECCIVSEEERKLGKVCITFEQKQIDLKNMGLGSIEGEKKIVGGGEINVGELFELVSGITICKVDDLIPTTGSIDWNELNNLFSSIEKTCGAEETEKINKAMEEKGYLFCPSCKNIIPPTATICPNCGQRLCGQRLCGQRLMPKETTQKKILDYVELYIKNKDLAKAKTDFDKIKSSELEEGLIEDYNYYGGIIYYLDGNYAKSKGYFQVASNYVSEQGNFANSFLVFLSYKIDFLDDKTSKEIMIESYNIIIPKVQELILKEKLVEELNKLKE